MSVQFPEAVDSSADVQIWNNAAFDNGEISEDLAANKQSWGSLNSIFENPKASFDSVCGKENHGPANQISSSKSSIVTPFKPVNTIGGLEKSKIRVLNEKGIRENLESGKEIRDEKTIDKEIEDIESEILRLNLRLEALRMEKAERGVAKAVEKRGRIVPAKFMEPKTSLKNSEDSSRTTKVLRRGFSLGPGEIVSGGRRGMNTEIFGGTKSRNLGKHEMVTPVQSRRKSCFWKLQEIDEDKVVGKERGKSASVSPKSRKIGAKPQVLPRQAVTTIASRKTMKKEDIVGNGIQPKKLFKEGEKSVMSNKKGIKPGRVVASRYNQTAMGNDKNDKKRSLSAGKSRVNTEGRVKKRWEIPSEIVVHGSIETVKSSPEPVIAVHDLLPRIRIVRCTKESPRDSGPAKKVAELIGRKSFFSNDEEEGDNPPICQVLDYPNEEVEES